MKIIKSIYLFLCVGFYCRKDNIFGRVLVEFSEFVFELEGIKVNIYMYWYKLVIKF